MVELPRSARLAAWGRLLLAGGACGQAEPVAGGARSEPFEPPLLRRVLRAVQGDDEPHAVALCGDAPALLPGLADGADLAAALAALRRAGVDALRVVLPAAGDVAGLPGPPAVNAAALEAGECVLTGRPEARPGDPSLGPALALIPEVTAFGSHLEPGALVTWRVHAVGAAGAGGVTGLAEAERELREAMIEATELLHSLDVARWRPDAATRIGALRRGSLPPDTVPEGTPARAVRVLALAGTVQEIVALAGEDDGSAVSGWEADRRRAALRSLDGVSRRALCSAVNATLEPAR